MRSGSWLGCVMRRVCCTTPQARYVFQGPRPTQVLALRGVLSVVAAQAIGPGARCWAHISFARTVVARSCCPLTHIYIFLVLTFTGVLLQPGA